MERIGGAEKGNVLFLILIAVALFAALSYVVTSSTRSGSIGIGEDRGKLIASDFMNYGIEIRSAIQRMITLNGCSETEINYSNPYFGTYYDNPTAPANKKCNIFAKEGGGVAFRKIMIDKKYSAVPELIGSFNVVDMGTNAPELMLGLFLQASVGSDEVNLDVCKYIFKVNKMDIPAGSADVVGSSTPFKGTYNLVDNIGDQVSALAKHDIGCWAGGPDQWYTPYVVLLER